jgi:hypothetical protein
MSEYEVLQQLVHEQEQRLHVVQGLHAELSVHNPHNDTFAVRRVTEVLAAWGPVNQGVFDEYLEGLVKQLQEAYGIHPADGVVRAETWAALCAEIQNHLTDLQHKMAAAEHANPNHGTFGHDGGGHDGGGHGGGHQPADPGLINQYLHRAGELLHVCSQRDNPLLSTQYANDSQWVQVVIDSFGLFDDVQRLDHPNAGPGWGHFSAGDYSKSLADAVRRYQNLNSIYETGQVDSATWQRLADDLHLVVQHLQPRVGH